MVVTNKAAVSTGVQGFVWESAIISFGSLPGRGMIGLYGRVCLIFKHTAKLFVEMVAPCYHFTAPPVACEVPVAPHPRQHLAESAFDILALLGVCGSTSYWF